MSSLATGASGSMRCLAQEDFLGVEIPTPDLQEQQAIADFLDRETSKLDSLITAKERLLDLLRERRAALVHHSTELEATRWLRFGAVASQVQRAVTRDHAASYQPVGLLNRGRGIFHKKPTLGSELGDSSFFWLAEGDLIFSGQFAWEGAVALAGAEDAGRVASHRYPLFRANPGRAETGFLFAFFTSPRGQFLLSENSRGAAGRNRPLNVRTLVKEQIPVPPLSHQAGVAAFVQVEKRVRQTIAKQLARLREQRIALISAAVTGRIDVREELA